MLVVDGPNGTTDMSSDSTVTTVTPQSQDEPIDITGTFSFDYSPYEDCDSDGEELFDHWRRLDPEIPQLAPSAFPFTGNPGFKISTINLKDPVDYFDLFFDDELVRYMVCETNRCADQFVQSEGPSSRIQDWYETSDKEFRTFLAALLFQGVVKKPKEEWYWSRRPCLNTPFMGELMSYKRYLSLKFFLYFSGKESSDSESPPQRHANKIYGLCDLLCNRFQDVYVPQREITINELFASCSGKEYKATEGIKIYELRESRSGYVWNLMICTGEEAPFEYEGKTYDTVTRYVITLVKDILNRGYCLSVDNSYTSPELTEFLTSQKTDIRGTVSRKKKKLPTFTKTEKVAPPSQSQKGKKQNIKPECSTSSVVHGDEMVGNSSGESEVVDNSNQYTTCYPHTGKRQKEYHKKIFRHLLDQVVVNSFVLYRKTGGAMNLLEFRLQILEELVKRNKGFHMEQRRVKGGVRYDGILRLTERHFPSLVPQNGRKPNPARKCVVCAKKIDKNGKRKRRETRYECRICDFGLCVAPCFEIYHTVEDF